MRAEAIVQANQPNIHKLKDSQQFFIRWKNIRDNGKTTYIIKRYVLSFIAYAVIIYPIITAFFQSDFSFSFFNSQRYLFSYVITIILFIVTAIIDGLKQWNKNEKKYLDEEQFHNS